MAHRTSSSHRPSRRLAARIVLCASLLGAACSSVIDGGGGGSDPATYVPAPAVLPRLTASQYRNSIVDLLGVDAPVTTVPADTNPYLFYSIGATTTQLSELETQQYAESAAVLADWVFADAARSAAVLGCTPTDIDDPCIEAFLRNLGLRVFRRPVTDEELADYRSVIVDTARGDLQRGLRLALYGLLQSPQFLYRAEVGQRDPADDSRRIYTSYEMAQRLSFLLWDSAPDTALLDAAGRGELDDEAGIYREALRLLESERASAATQAFFAQYLNLGALDALERDAELFPSFTETLGAAMKSEVRLLVDDYAYRRNADIRELFSSRRTYVNRELAELYGVEAPGATDVAFVPVELPADGPRAGLLTSAGVLAMNAHQTETSPTLRGKYLRERVLCQLVPAPPDDADFDIGEPDEEARTLRERLERHARDPQCAGCHSFLDPPGYLFEQFDALGVYRTEDNGYPVDSSGNLDGVTLEDARDLAEVLASDERVGKCMVKQLFRHANGRLDTEGEAPVLDALERAFAGSGYRFQDLLLELAISEGFRVVAAQEASP